MGVDASLRPVSTTVGTPLTPVKPFATSTVPPPYKSPLRRCLFGTPDSSATTAFLRSQLSMLFKEEDAFFSKYEIIDVIRKERKRVTLKMSKQKLITDYFKTSKSHQKLAKFAPLKRFPAEDNQDTRCIC